MANRILQDPHLPVEPTRDGLCSSLRVLFLVTEDRADDAALSSFLPRRKEDTGVPPKGFHEWKSKFFYIKVAAIACRLEIRSVYRKIPREALVMPQFQDLYGALQALPLAAVSKEGLTVMRMMLRWKPESRQKPVCKENVKGATIGTGGADTSTRVLRKVTPTSGDEGSESSNPNRPKVVRKRKLMGAPAGASLKKPTLRLQKTTNLDVHEANVSVENVVDDAPSNETEVHVDAEPVVDTRVADDIMDAHNNIIDPSINQGST
ncbi:hypothetical protein Hanom_Chr06g00549581 [Helianthus anomalus]